MRIFTLLLFSVTVEYISTVEMITLCELKGGNCIPKPEVSEICQEIPFVCDSDSVCCKTIAEKRSLGLKRKCPKTSKACQRHDGQCVAAKIGGCTTVSDDNLCAGSECTCCFKEEQSCSSSFGCLFRGGFCISSKKSSKCKGGTVNKDLCPGGECACCLPERSCQCGKTNLERIIGGEEVSPKIKYPWMAGIHDVTGSSPYICGGTLINDRYVISAAHCFFDFDKNPRYAENLQVGLADHNDNSMNDDAPGVTRLVDIEGYIVHEAYDQNTTSPVNDIALIELKMSLDLSLYKEIKPICLPVNKELTYEGKSGIVAGWGHTYMTPDPHVLMEVTLPILDPKCSGLVKGLTEGMLCAGVPEGGQDHCYGDSGGPLVVLEGTTYALVGIVSFAVSDKCAQPLEPGVYTRVTHYLDWIRDHTSDAYYCS